MDENKSVAFRIEAARFGGYAIRSDDGDILQCFAHLKQVLEHLEGELRECFDEGYPDRKMAQRFAPGSPPGMRLPDPASEFNDDADDVPSQPGLLKRAFRSVAGGRS